MLKQMASQNGRKSFDIVINKVNNEAEAKAIFDSISKVALQNLQVRLEYMGYIPLDEKLKSARQLCSSVVEAFPGAKSSVQFRGLAEHLMQTKSAIDEDASGLAKVMQRVIRQARPINNVVSAIT
jgi:flagellar biosynthesis protein FlhG